MASDLPERNTARRRVQRCCRMTLLMCLVLLSLIGCGGKEDRRLNILLISIDTLRADHLGCYGYAKETSPAIDRLAERGVRFEQAVSASPWTLPSHMSMMTSLYPEQHKRAWKTLFPNQPLTTLAEVLTSRGYITQGYVAVPFLKEIYGFDQGFSGYEFEPDIRAKDQTDKAIRWLHQKRPGDKPVFLFVHYFDPHVPYLPPKKYREKFISGTKDFPLDMNIFKNTFTGEEKTFLRALYDGEIRFADDQAGRLIQTFYQKMDPKKSLVVLVSDHGEEFWDHGSVDHGHTLFEEMIRVPLIFSAEGRLPSGLVLKNTVRTIDLMPTILDLCAIPVPASCLGVSLLSYIQGGGPPEEPAYSSSVVKGPEQKSLRNDQHKFIYNTLTSKAALYDLIEDPGEQENIIEREPQIAASFREVMDEYLQLSFLPWRLMMVPDGETGFSGTLRTDGTFLEVDMRKLRVDNREKQAVKKQRKLVMFPEGDKKAEGGAALQRVVISDDGKSLDFNFPEAREPYLISFNVSPRKSAIECRLLLDHSPRQDLVFLGSNFQSPDREIFTLSPNFPNPVEGDFSPPMNETGFYLWKVAGQDQTRHDVALDQETVDQLQALGYMDVTR